MDPQVRPFVQSLETLHKDIFAAVEPLTDREVNWAHPQLSNTIGILLRHVAGSERYWIIEIVGGREVPRDRDAEFGHEPLSKDRVVADLCKDILDKSPQSIRIAKLALNAGSDQEFHSSFFPAAELLASIYGNEENKEGINAFLQKRPPNFRRFRR